MMFLRGWCILLLSSSVCWAQPFVSPNPASTEPGDADAVLSRRNPRLRVRPQYDVEAVESVLPARVSPLPWLRILGSARNQAARGTCSIFSVTAWLEAVVSARTRQSIDYSEEWLKYVISSVQSADPVNDGAFTQDLFGAVSRYGMARERTLPYLGETWEHLGDSISRSRCGFVPAQWRAGCLAGHYDPRLLNTSIANPFPELVRARQEGQAFSTEHRMPGCRGAVECGERFFVSTPHRAKQFLASGVPVILDVDFYYGAWNHPAARGLGIHRDFAAWRQGIVGFPSRDTIDRRRSNDPGYETGHSVLVIGYDDEKEIETEETLTDGSVQRRRYRGVYYIRNAWGSRGFGREFEYRGERFAGYGMIAQKYAHQLGGFFTSRVE